MIPLRPYPLPRPGYTVPEFGGNLNGITDWFSDAWNILSGKPQSWYDRIDRLQIALAVRMSEIQAVGAQAWDAVRAAYFATTQGPDVDFWSFGQMVDQIRANLKTLILTKSHVPTDDQIRVVESFDQQYGRYVDYVKQMLPELAAKVSSDAAEVRNALSRGSLRSPGEVGREAFWDELARRAKLLGVGAGALVLLYLAIPVILAAALGGGRR